MFNWNAWRPRKRRELEALLENEDSGIIESLRINWAEHIVRLMKSRMPQKVLGEVLHDPERQSQVNVDIGHGRRY